MNEKIKNIIEWIICILIAVIIALFIKYFVGTPTKVQKVSMLPTLIENERLILNRWIRTTKQMPKRGDIITFEQPSKLGYSIEEIKKEKPIAKYEKEFKNPFSKFAYYFLEIGKTSYIKRVIALPGEHVEIKNNKVYINGKELEENYLQSNVKTRDKRNSWI